MLNFILGAVTAIVIIFLSSYIYARKRPRKVAESMMKFELQTEEQNLARLKDKVKKHFVDGK